MLDYHKTNINLLAYINPNKFMKVKDINELISNKIVMFGIAKKRSYVAEKGFYIKKDRFDKLFDKSPSYVCYYFSWYIQLIINNQKIIDYLTNSKVFTWKQKLWIINEWL